MHSDKTILPPLDYLLAFEMAAKFESFALASRALRISESAVSRKIRLLETHYDTLLFRRGSKSVALTPQGSHLFAQVQPAIQTLRDVSAQLIEKKNPGEISLAATNSVASLWLLPRLRAFNQANAHMNIKLIASDDDAECLSETVDLAILRGNGHWPDHVAQKLFGEIIFPVCSPAFLADHPEASRLETLPELPLVEVASKHTEWMDWNEWFSAHVPSPITPMRKTMFNAYPHAIQAAVDGLGIALGWGHLVDHLLQSGALVRPVERTYTRTEFGYFLLQRAKSGSHKERDTVKDWLLSESAARTPYAGGSVQA